MHSGLAAPQVRRGTRGAPGRPGGSSHKRHCDIASSDLLARVSENIASSHRCPFLPTPSLFSLSSFHASTPTPLSVDISVQHCMPHRQCAWTRCLQSVLGAGVSQDRGRCWGFPRSMSVLGFPKTEVARASGPWMFGAGVSQVRRRKVLNAQTPGIRTPEIEVAGPVSRPHRSVPPYAVEWLHPWSVCWRLQMPMPEPPKQTLTSHRILREVHRPCELAGPIEH